MKHISEIPYFTINREWIMEHRTPNGAWTKAQFYALGIEQETGWINKAVKKKYTTDQLKDFIAGKNIRAKQFRRLKNDGLRNKTNDDSVSEEIRTESKEVEPSVILGRCDTCKQSFRI
jgi:hypothetical protein